MKIILFILLTLCVSYSCGIYNSNRRKGPPLAKLTTTTEKPYHHVDEQRLTTVSTKESVYSSTTVNVNNKKIQPNKKIEYSDPVSDSRDKRPTHIDDNVIDKFNNIHDKGSTQSSGGLAAFFEKMSMFQLIMQASMEAIVSRVSYLESSISNALQPTKQAPEKNSPIFESNPTRQDRNNQELVKKVVSSFSELQKGLGNTKSEIPQDLNSETSESTDPGHDSKKEDCEKDPKGDDFGPEKFDQLSSIISTKPKDQTTYSSTNFDYDLESLPHKIPGEFSKDHNSYGSSVRDHYNYPPLGGTYDDDQWGRQKQVLAELQDQYNELSIGQRKKSPKVQTNVENPWTGQNENQKQNEYIYEDIILDPEVPAPVETRYRVSHEELEDTTSLKEYNNEDLWRESSIRPPQTRNKPTEPKKKINRTAFETDRSRANPRLEQIYLKLQRRENLISGPEEPDYDCLDDDGIDCRSKKAEDDYNPSELEELTKKDNFQARTGGQFNMEVQLLNLENAEKKLEELIRQTAMLEEVKELLKILDNFKPGCPYNVPSVRVGDHCYSIELSLLTFKEAQQFCKARGGFLAQEPLNVFLWSQISRAYPHHNGKEMWVGATDEEHEGRFNFFNGETVTSEDPRWEADSPSISTNRNCMVMDYRKGFTFKDMNCDHKHQFVCQYPLTSLI